MVRLLCLIVVLMGLLTSAGYAARDTQLIANWHPMFVEPALGYFGLSFFGHEHTRHDYPVADGALIDAPVTSCWDYDFLERDCDGPDHYKAFLDGSRVGAYKGDPSPISPPQAKACGITTDHRRYCISDWRDDGKTVWLDTGRDLERHTLAIGCPGPHFEYPCTSREEQMWIVIECSPHKTELRARGAIAAIVWMLIILAMGCGLGWIISSQEA